MCLMLTGRRDRKPENATRIGTLVRQSGLDQPVENTIERDAIKRPGAKGQFDVVMRQRCRCLKQNLQDTNARRRSARPGAADLGGEGAGFAVGLGGQRGGRSGGMHHGRKLEHRASVHATRLQVAGLQSY